MSPHSPPYVVFGNALEREIVASLRVIGEQLMLADARVGQGAGELLDVRRSQTGFFPQMHWLGAVMYHFGALANAEHWRFPLRGPTPVQFTCYNIGDYYDWHTDSEPVSEKASQHIRSVSVVAPLSGPGEFCGGSFEVRGPADNDIIEICEANIPGSVVVFPASTPHRITLVTGGVRRSLVAWLVGDNGA